MPSKNLPARPTDADNLFAASGPHNPKTCPLRSDGDGGAEPCNWYDHDTGLWLEGHSA